MIRLRAQAYKRTTIFVGLYFEIIRGILAVAEDVFGYLIEVHLLLWQNLLLREGGFFYAELFLELLARKQMINLKNFSQLKCCSRYLRYLGLFTFEPGLACRYKRI